MYLCFPGFNHFFRVLSLSCLILNVFSSQYINWFELIFVHVRESADFLINLLQSAISHLTGNLFV